jgi:hypothetical protein
MSAVSLSFFPFPCVGIREKGKPGLRKNFMLALLPPFIYMYVHGTGLGNLAGWVFPGPPSLLTHKQGRGTSDHPDKKQHVTYLNILCSILPKQSVLILFLFFLTWCVLSPSPTLSQVLAFSLTASLSFLSCLGTS